MKIAHLSATFPPYRGGTGNVCFHNALELSRRGHEVHVFTPKGPDSDSSSSGYGDFTVHHLRPLVQVGNAALLPQLLWVLHGFDVIHLHYPFFGGEMTALAAKLFGIPLVVTYHQDVFFPSGQRAYRGVVEKVQRLSIGQLVLRAADRVLFTSRDYGEASYVRSMVRSDALGELPNGVDVTRFSPAPSPAGFHAGYFASGDKDKGQPKKVTQQEHTPNPEHSGSQCGNSPNVRGWGCPTSLDRYVLRGAVCDFFPLADKDKVVLLVAALDEAHYFKGVKIFLSALAQLPPEVKGVIVGDGDLRSAYELTAQSLGMANRVYFAGRVSDEALPDYYRLADVTVLPSVTMGEAFGLVLLESLACGTPVIASNLPGVRTVVTEASDGFLVQPGNAPDLAAKLEKMLTLSAEERRIMGLAGRRKVETRYAWQRIGTRLEAIYRQVGHRPAIQYAQQKGKS